MQESARWARGAAEFGLIVAGVLVAFGVESWWSGVGERRAEGLYIEALEEELASNLRGVEMSLENRARAESELNRAVGLLDRGVHADSAEAFILGLTNGSAYESVPLVNDAVFEDLNVTGSFRLIRDDQLRRSIRYEYSRLDATWVRLGRAQASLRRDLSALVARHIPSGVLSRPTPLRVELDAAWPDLRGIAESIANDARLRSEINLTAYALAAERGYLDEALRYLGEYRAVLDAATTSVR